MMGLALTYIIGLESAVRKLFGSCCNLETSMVSAERCYAYTELEQEDENIVATDIKNWPETGDIAFEDYSVRYNPMSELILRDVSISISNGEKIGIIGRTGSGKSTLCMSLLRMIEASAGRIIVSGQNISRISIKKLRESIDVIPQDTGLFEGTLRFNIDPTERYTDKEIKKIAKKIHLNKVLKYEGNLLDFMVIVNYNVDK